MKLRPIISDDRENQVITEQTSLPVAAQETSPIIFKTTVGAPQGVEQAMDIANKVTGEAFGQAMMHTVQHDPDMQDKLLLTAKQVIRDKTDSISDMASTERTAKFFEKNEDACTYFGYDEKTTNKFHVKAMAAWAFILNTIYIFSVGFLIVAPIAFILKKLSVVIKKTWVAVIVAIVIYALIVSVPILIAFIRGKLGV